MKQKLVAFLHVIHDKINKQENLKVLENRELAKKRFLSQEDNGSENISQKPRHVTKKIVSWLGYSLKKCWDCPENLKTIVKNVLMHSTICCLEIIV